MSSEQLADGVNPLDAELAATWDVLKGYSGRDTDLGIARRFGGAAAAYSLRDIGAMNGRVVRVRRDSDSAEEDFSANQIASGALETWVQAGTDYSNVFSADAQVDGTGSTVSNASKEGGTLTIGASASGNNYLYFQLTDTVGAGSGDVFISFDYQSSNASVALNNVKLRNDSDGATSGDLVTIGTGDSMSIQKNGHYSGKLLNANLTDTGTRLAFLTTQTTSGYNFTISNLRYSRVSRNGFVRKIYDQSGNENHANQTSATKQPFVVENGGQIRMQNGNPAIKGTRYDSSNIDFLEMDNSVAEPTTIFSTYYTNRSFSLLHCGNNIGGTPRVQLNTNGIAARFSTADDMGTTSTDNTPDSLVTVFSAENGGTAILRKNGTQIDTLTRTEVENRQVQFLFRHQNNDSFRGVFLETWMVFNSDKTSDFTEIENELKRVNNIS